MKIQWIKILIMMLLKLWFLVLRGYCQIGAHWAADLNITPDTGIVTIHRDLDMQERSYFG